MVSDLARLATKYKAKEWAELAEWLEDPQRRQAVHNLLVELAVASATAGKQPKPRKRRKVSQAAKVREQLKKIGVEEPERADLLEDVWLKLRQRELLPSLPALRAFAEALGFKSLKGSRRDQAVTELMTLLIDLPQDSLDRKLREAAVTVEDRSLSDEYQDWVRLILQRPN